MNRSTHFQKYIALLAAACLAIFASTIAFYNLNNHSISAGSDEVIYARVIESITHDGEIFSPKHGNIQFYNKPPFKLWCDAVAVSIFGESNGGFRFVSALSGVLLVVLTTLAGTLLLESLPLGICAGFLLLAFPEFTISPHSLRRCVLDPFLSILIFGAVYAGYNALTTSRHSGRLWAVTGLIIGCSVLTKSVAGLLPWFVLGAFALTSQTTRRVAWSQRKGLGIGILLSIVLPACYYGILLYLHPKAAEIIFGEEIAQRAQVGFTGHNTGNPFFYLNYLVSGRVGPPILLLSGLLLAVCRMKRPQERLLLCWAIVPIVLYSLSESKVPWYLMPAFPAFAIISPLAVKRSSDFLAEKMAQGKIRFVALGILLTLVLLVLRPITGTLSRTLAVVDNQTVRLPIDLLADKLATEPTAEIFFIGSALSARANPLKNRFNLEGIYLKKFLSRVRRINSFEELPANIGSTAYVFTQDPTVPASYRVVQVLPVVPPREREVFVLKSKVNP